MASFSEFLGSLDPDAGKRGKQFEHFVKWFLKNDPEWSTQVDQVWLWDEYPDSWGRDCGIDLVFKHKNGENWAVQAKCYAPTTSITKADVDSFISESNRDGIDKRLLIATTDLIGANAKQVCDAQDKPVTRFLLSHFEDADIEYPTTLDELPKAKRKEKPKPRDHQIEAIEAVASNFKDVDRGQLIMACGTGKTFTTLWIKEKLGVESTLVLLPSLGLLSQTLHEWTLAANEEFQVLCVCSDESVGKKGSDEAVHSIADLAFPVTSSADNIKAFLNSSGKKVIFSTYQSSPLIAEAQSDKTIPAFDLAIADEAHRCAGKVSGDFSTILDGEKIRANKRLFTTATPRTYSSSVKKAAEDRGVEVVGMDDESVFGKQLFALNFGEAIKRGLLTDYRVVIIGVDDPTISAWIENRELLRADSDIEMDAESLAAQVGLLKAIKDYDLHRLISFHSKVSRAEDFSQNIHKVLGWIDEKHKPSGELVSDFVSGEMPTDKRRRKLSQLKNLKGNQRGLLTNARCLSEGVDVPSLDGVAFIDPKNSQIDIIQAVGRAIRLSSNKRAGTIILPIFIDKDGDPEKLLDEGRFKKIWGVLNALKSHDDVLANELDQMRVALDRRANVSGVGIFEKIEIDIPQATDSSFANALQTRLIESTTESWNTWWEVLKEYIQELGELPIRDTEYQGLKIGVWVSQQRSSYKLKILPKVRISKLEATPLWSWSPVEENWEKIYQKAKEFLDLHPNEEISQNTAYGEIHLGAWASTQRQNYKKNILTPEKIGQLEELRAWSWDPITDLWNQGYEYLKKYIDETGQDASPSNRQIFDGYPIGAWVGTQRRNYKNGIIEDWKIKLLEELPSWMWNPKTDVWHEKLRLFNEYVFENNTTEIPIRHVYKGIRLGSWASNQRIEYAEGKLDEARIALLNEIPGWKWDILDEKWVKIYSLLVKHCEGGEISRVPKGVKIEGVNLYDWILAQRSQYRNKKLSSERISKLLQIPGWSWHSIEDRWDRNFATLKNIIEGHESKCMPKISALEDSLATWVLNQRANFKKNILSPERTKLLLTLPGWIWDSSDEYFEEGFQNLLTYYEVHGNINFGSKYILPGNGFKLGQWLTSQRLRYSTQSLSAERIKKLESIPGMVWSPTDAKWEIGFSCLERYRHKEGYGLVPANCTFEEYRLGEWVSSQMYNYKKLKLRADRIKRLEDLDGWKWSRT